MKTKLRYASNHFKECVRLLLVGLCVGDLSTFAQAEVFTLNNGSVITAEWLNADDKAATVWKLRQTDGIELEIPRGSVKSVLSPIPSSKSYIENVGKVNDSVDAHRKIVDWSVKQGLMVVADSHRDRVVELDPDDKSAWAALGYTQTTSGWIRKETYWKRKGMQSKGGRWRFPQDILAEEQELASKTQMSELNRRIEQAIRDIKADNKKASVARQYLRDLNDPMAIPKLRELMVADRKNSNSDFRMAIIEIAGRIKTAASTQMLVDAAVADPDTRIADACVELLSQHGTELAISSFMGRLTNRDPAKDSQIVINRAARALSTLGDERCIPKLIDCLVTRHLIIPPPQPGTQATQTSDGAVNFAPSGNQKPVEVRLPNQEVLGALQTITKEPGFDYDKDAWLNWYAENFAPQRPDVYRDP
jgi:hypothetical protein